MSSASQKNKILQQLKLVLDDESDIVLAILFGSCAKGTATFNSDIDIAIKLNKPLLKDKKIRLIQCLANITGRAVDLVDLAKVGEPLLSQIIKHGELIKGNKQAYTEIAIKNVYANEDFLPYIKRSFQERRDKWIK